MGHADPPIRRHDHQIPQAQFEARVPAHAQDDDLSVEVPSFEQIFDRVERLHSSSSPGEGAFAPEPKKPTVNFQSYKNTTSIPRYRIRDRVAGGITTPVAQHSFRDGCGKEAGNTA